MGKKTKIVLPPELPAEIPDDEIELSSGDEKFVNSNKYFARFASNLDTRSIDKHVKRVADVKEDELESFYERRSRKKSKEKEEEEKKGLEVERVDALPVKTLDGKLYYKTVPKVSPFAVNGDRDNDDNEANGEDTGLMKPTKAEKKAKLKKLRKEAKKQSKETPKEEEVQQTPKAAVLAEVEKELSAEEANEAKKYKLAELGTELLTDPESNIKSLKEMLQISKDGDRTVQVLGLKSLLAVFKDIIPSYRIRLPTEKEQEMSISKAVKKMRFYESTLLTVYKAYLQRLIALEQRAPFQRVAIRCICTLLDAVPHFNFRENLLNAVIKNISSSDEVVRKLCCASIKSLFTNEGKHGGEATVAAVQLIAEHVKVYNCQLHPDSVEVLMSLSFDEDIGRTNLSRTNNKFKSKKGKFKKNKKEENKLPESDRKKSKKELMSKTRDEVDADFKAASFAQDNMERKKRQTEILSAIFEIFFRILKHTLLSISVKSDGTAGESMAHPLLSPCLNGIGKFAHLIDMDFMSDLISYLRKLAGGVNGSPEGTSKVLTLSERLRCCIVTFRVMKNNLDALNVDLQDFFVQLYNIIVEYRPGRDQGEVLAEALKIMLCDDRQHDMQRAAAFIKRLASFALCFGSAESMAALVTVKNLLQKNVKCRYLLENDAGGGSVSGQIAKYQPYASDPNLSGALASVLWELNILTKHFHPAVSTIALSISTMTASQDSQVYHSVLSPQQAFKESSLENEQFKLKFDIGKSNQKRKRGESKVDKIGSDVEITSLVDEDVVATKLCEHFNVIHDINETARLTRELNHTKSQLQLYKQFKKQKKENNDVKETKTKRKGKDTKAKKMRKS